MYHCMLSDSPLKHHSHPFYIFSTVEAATFSAISQYLLGVVVGSSLQ